MRKQSSGYSQNSSMKEQQVKKHLATHPGEILYNKFMKPRGLTATSLSLALQVTPSRICEILKGRRNITAETALRLSKFFGTAPQMWLEMQSNYELFLVEQKWGEEISEQITNNTFKTINRKDKRQSLLSANLTGTQKKIYALLSDEPVQFDTLCYKLGLGAGDLGAELTMLELAGLIQRHFGEGYSKAAPN